MSTVWPRLRRKGAPKVPEIALIFWVVKLLSTAMGESTSDFLVFRIDPYVAVVLGTTGLLIALAIQLRVRRYDAAAYWFAVVMVAVFGTMVADVAHVVLRAPYMVSAATLAILLVIVFAVWRRAEGTLSIHEIDRPSRELFYWATVMATFALGTALGDLTAATLGLGYPASAILYGLLFLAVGAAYRWFGANAVVTFWTAYVLTRPLGASMADWLGKPSLGGLGIGDGPVALILTALIVVLVAYLAVSRVDAPRSAA